MYYSSNEKNSIYYNGFIEEIEELEESSNDFSFKTIFKIGFITMGIVSIITINIFTLL